MNVSEQIEKKIYVYADFLSYVNEPIGTLYVSNTRGKEVYSFEYESTWTKKFSHILDPDIYFFTGRQYPRNLDSIFGMFADASPDRWGRKLMKRREEIRAKVNGTLPKILYDSDFLTGVFDEARMGGLRFKEDPKGEFLSSEKYYATPPWTSLRELEQASFSFEQDDNGSIDNWVRQLLAPGSSLGGARPKACVSSPDGELWIAKFPSKNDEEDIGAWEMVIHELAQCCGIHVPEAKAEQFSKLGTTFLVKRFDRNGKRRIHFASAMTMLGKTDGENALDGSGYLNIVSFLKANGAEPKGDMEELFRRIVFNMAVSNTDDHFRNHGFILEENGWHLSPMYDVNPDRYGSFLSLNVDNGNSNLDFELAREAAPLYGVSKNKAGEIIDLTRNTILQNMEKIAKNMDISRNEIESMKPAFRLCNS